MVIIGRTDDHLRALQLSEYADDEKWEMERIWSPDLPSLRQLNLASKNFRFIGSVVLESNHEAR